MNFDKLLKKVKHLNKKCFPDAKLEHNLTHLKDEADEVIAEPGDLEEWADMLICFLGGFGKTKFTTKKLKKACKEKIIKNLARNWEKKSNGTYKHVDKTNCIKCNKLMKISDGKLYCSDCGINFYDNKYWKLACDEYHSHSYTERCMCEVKKM